MRATFALALMACATPVCAQAPAPAANPFMGPVKTTPIRDGLTMLSAGSNAVLAVGEDKAILVDTLFFNADKLASAVRAMTPKPVAVVVNTHAHRDHTGGNALFAGHGAQVIATSAAARRIAEPSTNPRGEVQPPIDKAGWPTTTHDAPATIAVPGQSLRFIPVERSHMDGDAQVWFPAAKVLVMGDLHHSHEYPVYDGQSGCKCGSYEGNLRVYRQAIAMIDDSAIVVPGHGGLTNRRELIAYLAMLEKVRTDVEAAIAAGKSRAEVIAAKPLAGDRSIQPGGPDNADAFIGTLYDALKTGVGL
jgi:cyclase